MCYWLTRHLFLEGGGNASAQQMFDLDIVPMCHMQHLGNLSSTTRYPILSPLKPLEAQGFPEVYPGHKMNQLLGKKFSVWQ